MEKQTYEIHYDEVADFLEIFLGEPSECYAEEIEPGIVVRKDEKTNKVKSIGIFSFKKRAIALREILKKINLNFPLDVSV
jgi:UDP-N-acetylglucosamine:LPS N-acetylglucosamine transferase